MTLDQIKEMMSKQLFDQQLKEKEADFQRRVEEIKTQAYNQVQSSLANQIPAGWQQAYDPYTNVPLPMVQPNPTYIDYEQFKKTRIPSRESFRDGYDGALDYWQYMQQSKQSPTEALLDELFNSDEKLEYLLSMGYRELPNSSYLVKGTEVDPEFKRTYTLEEAFMIEMKVKLKNILLSKQALKFKI